MQRENFKFVILLLHLVTFVVKCEWVTYEHFFAKVIQDSLQNAVKEGHIVRAQYNCGKSMVHIKNKICRKMIYIG